MQTYSVNIGTETEANSYNLSDNSQFLQLLYKLRDNEDGEINPIDIRNSILSLWSNCVFKETTNNELYYIGIDVSNPDDRDLKNKILVGKRSNNQSDVFNQGLATSDSDIYFYDTKEDNDVNGQTKVSILAGNNSSLYQNAPYLSSQYVSDINALSFNIINQNGEINIKSNNDVVSINNIKFPTMLETQTLGNNLDGKSLKWQTDKLVWSDISLQVGNTLGNSNDVLNLQGEAYVNDYSFEFTDNRMVPTQIGSITPGDSFDSYSLSELLKRVVYSYQSPTGMLEILTPYQSGYIEVGTSPTVSIKYTINKKTLPTLTTGLQNMIPGAHSPITGSSYQIVTGTASAIISPSPALPGTQSYTIVTTDGLESNSISVDLVAVYPFYYGIGVNNSLTYTGMNFLIKLIDGLSDKNLDFLGSGKIFFLYPQEYGTLSEIRDNNNNNIISNFTSLVYSYSSPNGNFTSKSYWIYESISTYTHASPVSYSFKF